MSSSWNSSSIRNRYDSESENQASTKKTKLKCSQNYSLKSRVLSRVFSEDFEKVKKKTIIDPRGEFIRSWSNIFLVACLVYLFFDPLFLFLPKVKSQYLCLQTGVSRLAVILTFIRFGTDVFFVINILVRFRTAYVAPSSRVFGRGELVIDPKKVALRYIGKGFWFDLLAALPIPQVLIWGILPNLKGLTTSNLKTSLRFLMMIQYVQRLSIAYPLSIQIAKDSTGIVSQTAWLGAAYNLVLYLLSSHVMGSCFYLLAVQRVAGCWKSVCDANITTTSCNYEFFECSTAMENKYPSSRNDWIQTSNITNLCDANNGDYPYGIYVFAVANGVPTASLIHRYFYSLWFGLKSVSTLGQNLVTSIFIGENVYSIVIVMLGLLNLALLIGNIQMYLRSTSAHLEEWRLKKYDKEQWMHHRQLPPNLRQSVRRYDQHKWVATYGVNEEALLNDLPKGLRRRIKCHLSLNLVRRVPLLDEMDDRMLDSVCERLKPALWMENMFIIREGEPLNEMLFIIRGHVDSYTTNGGHIGFFNMCELGPGDFCGEELLSWAVKQQPTGTLPSSTRTVKAITRVEAFALRAEDLKFVSSQFQTLHSNPLRHKLRFHSHQWRMWAACFIQAAWRRYKSNKQVDELNEKEGGFESFRISLESEQLEIVPPGQSGASLGEYAIMLTTSIRSKPHGSNSGVLNPMSKPS